MPAKAVFAKDVAYTPWLSCHSLLWRKDLRIVLLLRQLRLSILAHRTRATEPSPHSQIDVGSLIAPSRVLQGVPQSVKRVITLPTFFGALLFKRRYRPKYLWPVNNFLGIRCLGVTSWDWISLFPSLHWQSVSRISTCCPTSISIISEFLPGLWFPLSTVFLYRGNR